MSKKSMDIDALIGNDCLEITIGGKTYIVEDVLLQIFLETASDAETDAETEKGSLILHKQLAKMLGVDLAEMGHIGYRAAALAVREIQKWLFETSGLDMPTEGANSEDPVNP